MSKLKTRKTAGTRRASSPKIEDRFKPKKLKEKKEPVKLEPIKIFVGYFVKYIGKHKHMSLSPGIGKVVPGKWYKVDENIFNALKQVGHWLAVKRYKDVDATKIKRR